MAKPVYRKGTGYVRSIRELLSLAVQDELDSSIDPYQRAVVRAMLERLTARELGCMEAYYVKELDMESIARSMDIHLSSVSRNIQRGDSKINSLLRLARDLRQACSQ